MWKMKANIKQQPATAKERNRILLGIATLVEQYYKDHPEADAIVRQMMQEKQKMEDTIDVKGVE
jgi:hypothetical protein